MDDKNLNPITDNGDNPAVEGDNPAVEGESDYEKFMKSQQDFGDAVNEVSESLPEDAMLQDEPIDEETQKKRKKAKTKITVLIVLIVLLFAATIFMIMYLVQTGTSSVDSDEIVISTGDVDSTAGEFVYWYNYTVSLYEYYGYSLTDEDAQSYTVNQMAYIDALYGKALEAGMELDDDDNAEIEDQMSEYKSYAESYSQTIDEFLEDNCGEGVTESIMRLIMEKQVLAQKYYDEEMSALESAVDDSAIEEEYVANKTSYDVIDISYYYFDSSDDDASDNVSAIVAAVESGSTFEVAISSVTGDSDPSVVDLQGYSYSSIESSFAEEVAEWIYAMDDDGEYTSVTGSVYMYESSGAIYVIYVNNVPARDETYPITVDYVAIALDDDDLKTEDELQLEAKSKATSILDEFNARDTQDSDTFLELIAEKTQEDSCLSYDEYYSGSSSIDAVDEWGFAEGRSVGDCEVVASDDVYYVFYFVGQDDQPVWYQTISDSLLETSQESWSDTFVASYEDSIVTNDDVIADVITYINSSSD